MIAHQVGEPAENLDVARSVILRVLDQRPDAIRLNGRIRASKILLNDLPLP